MGRESKIVLNFVTSFMKDPMIRQQRLTHIQHRRRRRPFSLFLQKKNSKFFSFIFSLVYFHVQSIKNFITSFFCKKKFGKFFNAIVIFADDSKMTVFTTSLNNFIYFSSVMKQTKRKIGNSAFKKTCRKWMKLSQWKQTTAKFTIIFCYRVSDLSGKLPTSG